jgi:hypothetical protein
MNFQIAEQWLRANVDQCYTIIQDTTENLDNFILTYNGKFDEEIGGFYQMDCIVNFISEGIMIESGIIELLEEEGGQKTLIRFYELRPDVPDDSLVDEYSHVRASAMNSICQIIKNKFDSIGMNID